MQLSGISTKIRELRRRRVEANAAVKIGLMYNCCSKIHNPNVRLTSAVSAGLDDKLESLSGKFTLETWPYFRHKGEERPQRLGGGRNTAAATYPFALLTFYYAKASFTLNVAHTHSYSYNAPTHRSAFLFKISPSSSYQKKAYNIHITAQYDATHVVTPYVLSQPFPPHPHPHPHAPCLVLLEAAPPQSSLSTP